MRLNCPHCGLRDVVEFTYAGDANRARPNLDNPDVAQWNQYVFDRVNTRGEHQEFWHHNHGCRAHLIVVRNTVSHEILTVKLAKQPNAEPLKKPRKRTAAK